MLRLLMLAAAFFGVLATATAQKVEFRTYTDTIHHISFDLPTYWRIEFSAVQGGIICVPKTKEQKDIYKDCFEGIVFRLSFDDYSLDRLLYEQFTQIGDEYVTGNELREDRKVKFIQGSNWKGIRHGGFCGISCKSTGFHAAAGQCQYVYFCKGDRTVEIQTNGRAFDEMVIARLIASFQYLN